MSLEEIKRLKAKNRILTKKLQICQRENRAYQHGFMSADSMITKNYYSSNKKNVVKYVQNILTSKEIFSWAIKEDVLNWKFSELISLVEPYFSGIEEVNIKDTLDLQKNIEQKLKVQDWSSQDQEKLKYLIFLLSLLYGSFRSNFQNNLAFNPDNT